jgi:hypothetical protein
MVGWGIVARMDELSGRMLRALCRARIGEEDAWADIGDVLLEVNGSSFHALGLNDEQVHQFARSAFGPVLTQPLREVSMGDLFMNGDDVVRQATGEAPPKRSIRERIEVMSDAARSYRTAAADGTFERPTMRMGFLAMKQLVYLEQYGRMYIPEESVLGDEAFVRSALRDAGESVV